MEPFYAKLIVLASSIALVMIRAPHGQRSRAIRVTESRKGLLETALLTLAWVAFVVPLIWVVAPVFAFADYPLRPAPLATGVGCLVLGLWLFARSHADLGSSWSITLELREGHQLVTRGVYQCVRHPMYLALLVYSVGQALVLPNWIAGPSYAVAMILLTAFRIRPEERMLAARFGGEYEAYERRTKRLFPGCGEPRVRSARRAGGS